MRKGEAWGDGTYDERGHRGLEPCMCGHSRYCERSIRHLARLFKKQLEDNKKVISHSYLTHMHEHICFDIDKMVDSALESWKGG